jgi:hypothetical protein
MHFESIAEVREWSERNNYVLGAPMLHRATYAIEHTDGTALRVEELQALQPVSSEAVYEERQRKAEPRAPVFPLNSGVAHARLAKLRRRQP